MTNSRDKGKRGELEWAAYLRALGFTDAKRGQQHKGGPESPDVTGVAGVHFEVKRVEALNLGSAIAQALKDCGANIPVVAHRRNRTPWQVTIPASRLLEFCKAIGNNYEAAH